ncbi:MAG: hypothetical protein ACOC0N_05430 [Chroococcales cyanobacterium]
MIQEQFNLEDSEVQFLNQCQKYGFNDKSEMVRAALKRLQVELDMQDLKESAELYAELWEEDKEIRELTESALFGFPE